MTEHTREPTGSLAEEAARLFAVLQQRLGGPRGTGEPPSGQGWTTEDVGTAAECRVCPLCQALAAMRAVNPEVVEHLATAAGELTAALRAVVDGRAHTAHERHAHSEGGSDMDVRSDGDSVQTGARADDRVRPPRIEHIEVR